MPNVIARWDFETGDTQGWSLSSNTVIDNTSKMQGIYSLKFNIHIEAYAQTTPPYNVALISGIDLSNTSKPILVIPTLLNITHERAGIWTNYTPMIRVRVYDSVKTYVNVTLRLGTWGSSTNGAVGTFKRVLVVDLYPALGKSNLTISIDFLVSFDTYGVFTVNLYLDNIAILDGGDYEYNTGIMLFDNESKVLSFSIPSPDSDISALNTYALDLCLATPDWDYKNVKVTVTHNQGSLVIDSSAVDNYHLRRQEPSTPPSTIQSVMIQVWGISVGARGYWLEKVALSITDNQWNLLRLYVINIYFTANGVTPRFINSVINTSYGTLVSGYRDLTVYVYGNAFDLALKVKYLYGSKDVVTYGKVTMAVYSSDLVTKYGEVEVDLTTGNEVTSPYITLLPTGVDLAIRFSFTIQSNARVVLLIYPLFKIY